MLQHPSSHTSEPPTSFQINPKRIRIIWFCCTKQIHFSLLEFFLKNIRTQETREPKPSERIYDCLFIMANDDPCIWPPELLLCDCRCFNLLLRKSIYVLRRYLTEFVRDNGGFRISIGASTRRNTSNRTAFEYWFPAFSISPITSLTYRQRQSH